MRRFIKENKTETNLFLLQINLVYGVYQILTQRFYDLAFMGVKEMIDKEPVIGKKQTIGPSLKAIQEYRVNYGL